MGSIHLSLGDIPRSCCYRIPGLLFSCRLVLNVGCVDGDVAKQGRRVHLNIVGAMCLRPTATLNQFNKWNMTNIRVSAIVKRFLSFLLTYLQHPVSTL